MRQHAAAVFFGVALTTSALSAGCGAEFSGAATTSGAGGASSSGPSSSTSHATGTHGAGSGGGTGTGGIGGHGGGGDGGASGSAVSGSTVSGSAVSGSGGGSGGGGQGGAAVSSSGTGIGAADGSPCASDSACASGFCVGGVCAGGCGSGPPCAFSEYCLDGLCVPLKALGASCADGNECLNSVCADGVCCNAVCDGVCQACSAAKKGGGMDGSCANIPTGLDPDNECTDQGAMSCKTDGFCGGVGSCRLYVSGTPCGPASCSNQGSFSGGLCDGAGTCGGVAQECAPYGCTANGCKATCDNDADCVSDAYCAGPDCTFKGESGYPCFSSNHCKSNVCLGAAGCM